MRKTKPRSKENDNQPGERGMFYCQKKCFTCGKLIVGENPKNHRLASKDCYLKMKAHKEEHEKEKEGKKLNLLVAGTLGEQSQTIRRVMLRGEKKDAHTANLRHLDRGRRPI